MAKAAYRAVYANLETAQAAGENVTMAMADIVQTIANKAVRQAGDPTLKTLAEAALAESAPTRALQRFLTQWCERMPQPLVLMLDEVDTLVGDTLIALLRQLRAGHTDRPAVPFPQSVILCGVRDLRNYRIHARSEPSPITGGSAFNIKAESLRLGDFTADKVRGGPGLLDSISPSLRSCRKTPLPKMGSVPQYP